jgi:hypothetical protein
MAAGAILLALGELAFVGVQPSWDVSRSSWATSS